MILYLHGFASSPQSSKATFFASRLAALGAYVDVPDLNEPDFSTLTLTRMIQQVVARIDARPGEPVALIGSSLGGFVAVQTSVERPERVDRMILMAPALDLGGKRLEELGDRGLDEWKRTGHQQVFHYGYGHTMPLHYGLYEDVRRYATADVSPTLPVQIFQGRRDTAVDPETVERWAKARPNVELHMLDDDHQLTASLPYIWERAEPFLRR